MPAAEVTGLKDACSGHVQHRSQEAGASRWGDASVASTSHLPLSLRACIARDAIAALRYQADGGLHANGAAAAPALDMLEAQCRGLFAAEDVCSTASLSEHHAGLVDLYLAQHGPLSSSIPEEASVIPASGPSAAAIHPEAALAEAVGGLRESDSSPARSLPTRADKALLEACVQELAASECPASLIHHLISTCSANGLPPEIPDDQECNGADSHHVDSSPEGQSLVAPGGFLCRALTKLAKAQISRLAHGTDPQQYPEEPKRAAFGLSPAANNGSIYKARRGGLLHRARAGGLVNGASGVDPLQVIGGLLVCLADRDRVSAAEEGNLPSSSAARRSPGGMVLSGPTQSDEAPLSPPWLQHARGSIWSVLLPAALNTPSACDAGGLHPPDSQTMRMSAAGDAGFGSRQPQPDGLSPDNCSSSEAGLPAHARTALLEMLQQLQAFSLSPKPPPKRLPGKHHLVWAGWQPPLEGGEPAPHSVAQPRAALKRRLLLARTLAAIQAGWEPPSPMQNCAFHGIEAGSDASGVCQEEDLISVESAAKAFEQLLGRSTGSANRLRTLSSLLADVWAHGHVFASSTEVCCP